MKETIHFSKFQILFIHLIIFKKKRLQVLQEGNYFLVITNDKSLHHNLQSFVLFTSIYTIQ